MRPNEVFHSTAKHVREKLDITLVRPERGGNLGSTLRALHNMGILGTVFVVETTPEILNEECKRFAKHAASRMEQIKFVGSLRAAIGFHSDKALVIASTARIASPKRPHPIGVREAMSRAIAKLGEGEIQRLNIVFGPESDGLTNAEIALCDWVATIPSSKEYSSLNLAQSILVFAYEANMNMTAPMGKRKRNTGAGQRQRLISHVVEVAKDVGFVLPEDPFKMRSRLEKLLEALPPHIDEAQTWHGLLDQVSRSVKKGEVDFKGRYRRKVEELS